MTTPDPLPELRLQGANYTVYHYLERSHDADVKFDLDAPYQRGSVWTVEQRQNLIKSLVMGLPVGTVIISCLPYRPGGASYRIVDGKQRIEAVRAFFADEFMVPGWWFREADLSDPGLRGVDVWASDLSGRGRRGIENSQLGSIEFNGDREYTENPDYDPTLRVGYPEYKANPHKTIRYTSRDRTDEEILRAEAELYVLVNFGGVAQTDEDRARAERIAEA